LILIGLPAGQLLQQYLLAPLQLQALRLFLLLPLLATLAWGLPHLLRRMRPGWLWRACKGCCWAMSRC
jgi:electron transport complex protein RnfA